MQRNPITYLSSVLPLRRRALRRLPYLNILIFLTSQSSVLLPNFQSKTFVKVEAILGRGRTQRVLKYFSVNPVTFRIKNAAKDALEA